MPASGASGASGAPRVARAKAPAKLSPLKLPIRITRADPSAPVVMVDGHLAVRGGEDPRGLELSHWPGNRTPEPLRHELSTGCVLAFDRLAASERDRLAAGAVAIVNNHYDTDGVMALFAARHPEIALEHADALLRIAAAGDFFRWPDDDALAIDAIVLELDRSSASPLAAETAELGSEARWQRCVEYVHDALPAMLAGDLTPWRALFEPTLDRARRDRETLAAAQRTDDAARDLAVWSATTDARPGRHALFGSTASDRVLVLGARDGGTTTRLVVSTVSWFEPIRTTRLARPDLESLARHLNELEGAQDADEHAWRAQSSDGASPELWFGTRELALFVEHNDALAPSSLSPATIRTSIERALSPS